MLKRAATFSLILFGVHYVSAQYKCSLPLEAENGNGGRKQPRSEASGGVAVTLYKDEEIDLRLHLGDTKNTCYLLLLSVTYSNDGPADTVNVSINGTLLWSFNTTEEFNGGHNWNVFYEANVKSPFKVQMSDGQSLLKISAVETDANGVEIDYILLELYCPHIKISGECPLTPVINENCMISDRQNEYDYVPKLEILAFCGLFITICGIVSGYCFFALKLIISKSCGNCRKGTDTIELMSLSSIDDNKQTVYKYFNSSV